MFNNSAGRWVLLALAVALAAWGVSHIFPGVQVAAQNELAGGSRPQGAAEVTVKSFGATGDGVSDDAGAILDAEGNFRQQLFQRLLSQRDYRKIFLAE